jgi:cytochrome P450
VLLFGGIETTEGMIANAILALLERPKLLAAVRAEQRLVAAAIEESLRLEPAAAVVDRYATGDARLGGVRIGRGELVRLSITAANRDPAVFANPDRFELRQGEERRHLAFAHGPHVCVGMHLARLEALRGPGLTADPAAATAARPRAPGDRPWPSVPQAAGAQGAVRLGAAEPRR